MSTLMIRCPKTGQSIPTGIETDHFSFRQMPELPTRARCPVCGIDHLWWKSEAWLAEYPPYGSPRVAPAGRLQCQAAPGSKD
jgi:hypothetical protein